MSDPEPAVDVDLIANLTSAAIATMRGDPGALQKAITACEQAHRECRDEPGRVAILRLWNALELERDRVQPRLDLRAQAAGTDP